LELSADHQEVLDFIRQQYIERGLRKNGREMLMALEEAFSAKGGGGYLYTLFPKGPVNQGSRIAGVPIPPHSSDQSFGSAM
jgi:tRNA 2-thiouridine synthesizing protein E